MNESLDSLRLSKLFLSLDANSGYWQIELDANDVDETAFVTYSGLYSYTRMSLVLKNALGTFQLAMDIVLGPVKWQYAFIYINDVVIFSKSRKTSVPWRIRIIVDKKMQE